MAYEFEGAPVNVTSLGSGVYSAEPTAVQYHTNRINCVYRKANLLYIQYSDDRGSTWSEASQIVSDTNAKQPDVCYNYRDGWALIWSAYTNESNLGYEATEDWEIKFTEALARKSIVSDILEADVDKGMDMVANSFRCLISSENGQYDFQNASGSWVDLLIGGNKIIFYGGLGTHIDKRFEGYIDTVKYKDAEGVIELSARSNVSKVLDGSIGQKTQFTTSKTYNEVISELLDLAGIDSDDYHVESSLVTLAEEKVFDREETFATCISEVMDDLGWVIWEDEDGRIWVGSPTNYPANLWNYFMNVNCFALERNLDKISVPSEVIVSNEDAGIEKSATVETNNWVTLDVNQKAYISTKEDDADNIQTIADNIASDLELKIFTMDLLVPYNFYLQLRDRIKIFQTKFDSMVSNTAIITRITESVGRKGLRNPDGLFSRLSVSVIS